MEGNIKVIQDGEGEFFNNTTNTWRKGIWSEGKRTRWLDEDDTNIS